jgi:hypothetical protein
VGTAWWLLLLLLLGTRFNFDEFDAAIAAALFGPAADAVLAEERPFDMLRK